VVELQLKDLSHLLRRKNIRIFLLIIFFIAALDATIAVNRWWTISFEGYLQNIIVMTSGFILFSILAARSKLDFIGFIFLSIAIFYTANYEIGGPSKNFLTPYDPILGISEAFGPRKYWLGIRTTDYRLTAAIITTILTAVTLTISRARSTKTQELK